MYRYAESPPSRRCVLKSPPVSPCRLLLSDLYGVASYRPPVHPRPYILYASPVLLPAIRGDRYLRTTTNPPCALLRSPIYCRNVSLPVLLSGYCFRTSAVKSHRKKSGKSLRDVFRRQSGRLPIHPCPSLLHRTTTARFSLSRQRAL